MTLRDALNLIEGEHAWRVEVWTVRDDRLLEPQASADFYPQLAAAAGPLLLEAALTPDGHTLAVVHRSGWPFDLRTATPAPNLPVADTLARGPGDEVLRELCHRFAGSTPGYVLVIMDA